MCYVGSHCESAGVGPNLAVRSYAASLLPLDWLAVESLAARMPRSQAPFHQARPAVLRAPRRPVSGR